MQLSSLALSASVLLAQAALGFYISCPELDPQIYSIAKVHHNHETGRNSVGFYHGIEDEPADIVLNGDGGLGNGFVLRQVDPGLWLLSEADGPSQPTDITGPFAVDQSGDFTYIGDFSGVWNVCQDPARPGYQITLSRTPIDSPLCFGAVPLLVEGP